MSSLKDTRRIQLAAVALACALFGAIDLVVVFLTPGVPREPALLPPVLSAVIVMIALPFLLRLFERQQVHINEQAAEIETLHAMDGAIVSEMELPKLLPVAAEKALTACDGEASGVVIFDPISGKLAGESFRMPDVDGEVAKTQFMLLSRAGSVTGDADWDTLVEPLVAAGVGGVGGANGYLLVARRRGNNRPFTPTDRRLLSALCGTLRIAVGNVRALVAAREALAVRAELQVTRVHQKRDQALARAMTEGLLPEIPERIGAWEFSQKYQAQSDEAPVGGDLYDLFRIAPGRWGVFIADVSGKGLAAARKVALVKYALRSYAREHASPAHVLDHLNETLFDEPEMTGFVTLFYAVLDEQGGEIAWASAGHETPVLRRANGDCETLYPTGPVLGAMNEITYTEGRSVFNPGDGLLLFTDGMSEARSKGDRVVMLEVKGIERELGYVLAAPPDAETPPVAEALMGALYRFTGGTLTDDTALFWMRYAPGSGG